MYALQKLYELRAPYANHDKQSFFNVRITNEYGMWMKSYCQVGEDIELEPGKVLLFITNQV